MFKNKMTSRALAEARYGHIDLAHAHWPNETQWIKSLVIPEGMFPNWKVQDTVHIVKAISCNIDIHEPLMNALKAVHDKGLGHELKTYDGCFNIRAVRGSTSESAHAFGLAIDIDANENPMSSHLHTTFTPDFVKCFTDQGFAWGGNFHSRKDPMHFSYCWEG